MSFPDLTPTSTTSAITLPVTSSDADLTIQQSLAIGFYTGSAAFLAGAKSQVAFTYKRLGGDVLDIEITAGNVYNHYEEAVLEYSYIVNLHQARNSLGSSLGGTTGSFNHKGEELTGNDTALKYPKFKFDYAFRVADRFSTEAMVGGTETLFSASFDMVANQQDYDLQNIVENLAAAEGEPFSGQVGNQRIKMDSMLMIQHSKLYRHGKTNYKQ